MFSLIFFTFFPKCSVCMSCSENSKCHRKNGHRKNQLENPARHKAKSRALMWQGWNLSIFPLGSKNYPEKPKLSSACGSAPSLPTKASATVLQSRRLLGLQNAFKNQTPPSYGFGRYGFGFFGPRIAFRATGALWGRATPFFYHFSVHLNSVLGGTELCLEVWTPGPQKPQIISNENHHLALLEKIVFLMSSKMVSNRSLLLKHSCRHEGISLI